MNDNPCLLCDSPIEDPEAAFCNTCFLKRGGDSPLPEPKPAKKKRIYKQRTYIRKVPKNTNCLECGNDISKRKAGTKYCQPCARNVKRRQNRSYGPAKYPLPEFDIGNNGFPKECPDCHTIYYPQTKGMYQQSKRCPDCRLTRSKKWYSEDYYKRDYVIKQQRERMAFSNAKKYESRAIEVDGLFMELKA